MVNKAFADMFLVWVFAELWINAWSFSQCHLTLALAWNYSKWDKVNQGDLFSPGWNSSCVIYHIAWLGCIPLYGCTKPSKKWRKKVVSKNILIFSFYHKYGVKVLHNSKYYDVLELQVQRKRLRIFSLCRYGCTDIQVSRLWDVSRFVLWLSSKYSRQFNSTNYWQWWVLTFEPKIKLMIMLRQSTQVSLWHCKFSLCYEPSAFYFKPSVEEGLYHIN